jgi:hypothetical protein
MIVSASPEFDKFTLMKLPLSMGAVDGLRATMKMQETALLDSMKLLHSYSWVDRRPPPPTLPFGGDRDGDLEGHRRLGRRNESQYQGQSVSAPIVKTQGILLEPSTAAVEEPVSTSKDGVDRSKQQAVVIMTEPGHPMDSRERSNVDGSSLDHAPYDRANERCCSLYSTEGSCAEDLAHYEGVEVGGTEIGEGDEVICKAAPISSDQNQVGGGTKEKLTATLETLPLGLGGLVSAATSILTPSSNNLDSAPNNSPKLGGTTGLKPASPVLRKTPEEISRKPTAQPQQQPVLPHEKANTSSSTSKPPTPHDINSSSHTPRSHPHRIYPHHQHQRHHIHHHHHHHRPKPTPSPASHENTSDFTTTTTARTSDSSPIIPPVHLYPPGESKLQSQQGISRHLLTRLYKLCQFLTHTSPPQSIQSDGLLKKVSRQPHNPWLLSVPVVFVVVIALCLLLSVDAWMIWKLSVMLDTVGGALKEAEELGFGV